jgi:hypothetical protein
MVFATTKGRFRMESEIVSCCFVAVGSQRGTLAEPVSAQIMKTTSPRRGCEAGAIRRRGRPVCEGMLGQEVQLCGTDDAIRSVFENE